MSFSKKCKVIQNRKTANDIFITPKELSKIHIDLIDYKENDLWLDPCKNNGSYYDQFPNDNKDWCEILDDKDFFQYSGSPDIIIQNPPFSLINKWIDKNIELKPRVISFLIGLMNLTMKRVATLEEAGYGLTKFHIVSVYSWFGSSVLVVFEKDKKSIITYNRKSFHNAI